MDTRKITHTPPSGMKFLYEVRTISDFLEAHTIKIVALKKDLAELFPLTRRSGFSFALSFSLSPSWRISFHNRARACVLILRGAWNHSRMRTVYYGVRLQRVRFTLKVILDGFETKHVTG